MMTKEERAAAASERMHALHAKRRAEKAEQEAEFVEGVMEAAADIVKAVRNPAQRTRRNIFNGEVSKLAVEGQDPAYRYYWFNNDPGRVEDALDSGYEFVKKGDVKVATKGISTDGNIEMRTSSNPEQVYDRSVLMRIPKEFYEEDQQTMAAKVDAEEQKINEDAFANVPGAYVPDTHKGGAPLRIKRR